MRWSRLKTEEQRRSPRSTSKILSLSHPLTNCIVCPSIFFPCSTSCLGTGNEMAVFSAVFLLWLTSTSDVRVVNLVCPVSSTIAPHEFPLILSSSTPSRVIESWSWSHLMSTKIDVLSYLIFSAFVKSWSASRHHVSKWDDLKIKTCSCLSRFWLKQLYLN